MPATLQAGRLDTYMLRDSKGNLVPVPDWTYEEFEELLRMKRGLAPPPPPPFTLDAIAATGTVEKNLAHLDVTATVRVRESGWVRVPLEMGQAILRGEVKHQGKGEHFVAFDQAAGGYVAWLSGAGEEPHVVTAKVSVPLEAVGDGGLLALDFPRATQSSLRLSLPHLAEASLLAGEGLVSATNNQGRTEVEVLGPSGELQLSWRKAEMAAAPGPAALESSGEITIKVEGENRVTSEARLRIRAFSGELSTLQVQLPPGMELQPTTHVGYSVTLLPQASSGRPGANAPQGLEVKLDRPSTGIVEVRLVATSAATSSGLLLPARFNVVGAIRQRGTVDCTVEGDWLLTWKEDASVRRQNLPVDAPTKLAARYEYLRQPCGLGLTVSTRPSRVTVEPMHVVYVDAQRIRIESTLKYKFRGARASELAFDMAGWTLDRLSPSDYFDLPAEPGMGRFSVPLSAGATLPPELDLKFEAQQSFDPLAGSVAFTLPRPVADVVTPATVLVVPADNVELAPQAELISGLTPDWSPTTLRIPARQQSPLAYRSLGGNEPASFAAGMRVRPQAITASARATVRIGSQRVDVEQQLNYRIAHVPARQFQIVVPRSLVSNGPWEVSRGGESLSPTPVLDASSASETLYQLVAATDQIGQCQFVVKYSLPLPKITRGKPASLVLPLVIPAEAPNQQLGGQQIEIFAPEAWQLEADSTGTSEFTRPTPAPSSGSSRAFAWSRMTPISRWHVQSSLAESASDVAISKAWLQTWLSGGTRQERAAFRLATDREQLRFTLPREFARSSVQAAVNAQPVTVLVREPNSVLLSLPAAARNRESVVELWYSVPAPPQRLGLLGGKFSMPMLDEAAPPRRVYWQLCLPDDQHLLATPSGLATEATWGGRGLIWSRQPALSQEQLEGWLGASRQDPLPRGSNQYLFSSLGRITQVDVWVANQRLLLLVGSGLVLACGLAWLHLRALRRAEALLSAALVLGALLLAWPDAAVLLSQAGAVGLMVALLAASWFWLTSGKSTWAPTVASSRRVELQSRTTEAPATGVPVARVERGGSAASSTAPAMTAAGPSP
jgi:hypothetical protein